MTTATAVKERPILFSGPMVRALLDGRKTQTRRVITDRREWVKPEKLTAILPNGKGSFAMRVGFDGDPTKGHIGTIWCPYGVPGDRLWVRETCRAEELPNSDDGVRYLADAFWKRIENTQEAADRWVDLNHHAGKKGATVPSIYMPRWACRIVLEVTEVRVQRLQDISEMDARAEGIRSDVLEANEDHPRVQCWVSEPDDNRAYKDARDAFHASWNNINRERGYPWESNPWVWCVTFKLVQICR